MESRGTKSLFSCELSGSTASLLGTGVMVEGRFAKGSELDLVVFSLRQEDDDDNDGGEEDEDFLSPLVAMARLEVGLERVWAAALEKKPKMLCCLPVDEELGAKLMLPLDFFAVEGVFAGVRAGTLELSPIFEDSGSIG